MPRRNRPRSSSTAVVLRTSNTPSRVARPNTSQRRRRNIPAPRGLHPDALAYAHSLSNPFIYPPVKLGFGCFVSSDLFTLTVRFLTLPSADGSIAAFLAPCSAPSAGATGAGGLFTSTSNMADAMNWAGHHFANADVFEGVAEECRIVSGGIRMLPMVPGTSAPGVAYACSSPSTNYTSLAATTKEILISNPLFTWGQAASGASVTVRPIDPNSFTFHHDNVTGVPNNTDYATTVPIIVMTGLPTTGTVLIEAVLNVEYIRSVTYVNYISQGTGQSSPTSSLPRLYPNVESMWSSVSPLVPSATTVASSTSMANTLVRSLTSFPGEAISRTRNVIHGLLNP